MALRGLNNKTQHVQWLNVNKGIANINGLINVLDQCVYWGQVRKKPLNQFS
jgi:hypothetical protein